MKTLLRTWIINSMVLAILAWFFPGISLSFQPQDFLLASLLLTLILKLIKPLFDLAFLPIHLLTFGLTRWLRILVAFLLTHYLIPNIVFVPFYFPGFTWGAIQVQSFQTSWFISLILGALFFNLLKKLISWLLKK
jgi:uncharacterized membrane protein YvlD (DUF360 family)